MVLPKPAADQRGVERVLRPLGAGGAAEEALGVGLVVTEQEVRCRSIRPRPRLEAHQAQRGVPGEHRPVLGEQLRPRPVALGVPAPGPGIAEPQGGQHVEDGGLWPAVGEGEAEPHVVRGGLGVLGQHVEVPVAVEDAGVENLELRLHPPPLAVHLQQLGIGKGPLRILVERLEVAGGRGGVEEVVQLLHVLPVVSLQAIEAVEPLLEDGVLPVPEGDRQAETALAIGDPQQAILTPAIGPGARHVVGEVPPRFPGRGIVLPHRPPLAVGEVGTPALPVLDPPGVLRQPLRLRVGGPGRGHGNGPQAKQHTSAAATGEQPQESACAKRGRYLEDRFLPWSLPPKPPV